MYNGVGVLLKRNNFAILKFPYVYKRRCKTLARRFVFATVFAECDDGIIVGDKFIGFGSVAIPVPTNFHENFFKYRIGADESAAIGATFRFGSACVWRKCAKHGWDVALGEGGIQAANNFSVLMHGLSPLVM